MAIVINGSGTVTGLAVGGLPDGTVDAGTLATISDWQIRWHGMQYADAASNLASYRLVLSTITTVAVVCYSCTGTCNHCSH